MGKEKKKKQHFFFLIYGKIELKGEVWSVNDIVCCHVKY